MRVDRQRVARTATNTRSSPRPQARPPPHTRHESNPAERDGNVDEPVVRSMNRIGRSRPNVIRDHAGNDGRLADRTCDPCEAESRHAKSSAGSGSQHHLAISRRNATRLEHARSRPPPAGVECSGTAACAAPRRLAHSMLWGPDRRRGARLDPARPNCWNTPACRPSYAVEYHFAGGAPTLYHFDNLLLHLMNVALAAYLSW